tara:strand:+ start:114 stop:620 length:507 start_codon:yes stop_codon:yes gene_type:complete
MIVSQLRKYKSKLKLNKLVKAGLTIGKGCRIMTKFKFTEPYLITIGDYVSIGTGVQIIPHDGAVWTLRHLKNNLKIDRFGKIKIGSNVFVGNNAIILPDTVIGDNIIIGANSIVRGVLEANSVYAGVPVKRVCSIEEYYLKYESRFLNTKGLNPEMKKEIILKNLDKI